MLYLMSENRTNDILSCDEPGCACGARRCRMSNIGCAVLSQGLRIAPLARRSIPRVHLSKIRTVGIECSQARSLFVRSCDRPGWLLAATRACAHRSAAVRARTSIARSSHRERSTAALLDRIACASASLGLGGWRPATQPRSSERRCRSSSPAAGAVVRGRREPQQRRRGRRPSHRSMRISTRSPGPSERP